MAAAPTEVLLPPVCSRPLVTPFSPFFLHFRLRMSDRVKIRKESTRMSARIKSCGALEYFPPIPRPLRLSGTPSGLLRLDRPLPLPSPPPPPTLGRQPTPLLAHDLAAQGDKMGHYAARKILQSSLRQASPAAVVHSLRPLLLVGAEIPRSPGRDESVAWRRATHSTAHASDIISHVTLIFESSRYVDCIRSASVSVPRNIPSFLPSFLPSFRPFLHQWFTLRLPFSIFLPSILLSSFFLLFSSLCFSSSALVKLRAPPSSLLLSRLRHPYVPTEQLQLLSLFRGPASSEHAC